MRRHMRLGHPPVGEEKEKGSRECVCEKEKGSRECVCEKEKGSRECVCALPV